jgi:hypothetical protein
MLRSVLSPARSARAALAVLAATCSCSVPPSFPVARPRPGAQADDRARPRLVRGCVELVGRHPRPPEARLSRRRRRQPAARAPEDSAYLKTTLAQIKGPIVLVGHSYGGMVISDAAPATQREGARLHRRVRAAAGRDAPAAHLARAGQPPRPQRARRGHLPDADGRLAPEGTVKPQLFHTILAGDLPVAATRVAAASQRPTALSTLTDPAGPPAWATIPSWYLVAGADNAVGTANERFMAGACTRRPSWPRAPRTS